MSKKLSRRDAAKLLNLGHGTLQRLALIATQDDPAPPDMQVWLDEEYTEQDNLLFRLFVELKQLLPDSSEVFGVLLTIWFDSAADLVDASHRLPGEPPGVVVVADKRYVRWPGRTRWLDLWEPNNDLLNHVDEASLRITTAIHLQALLQPLQQAE